MIALSSMIRLPRRELERRLAIDMLNDHPHILEVARHLTERVSSPVLGGIAVFLHGYPRTTKDLDYYTNDRVETDRELRAAGAVWEVKRREHVFKGVRIHTVTPEDAGHTIARTSMIDGIRVISLRDLVAIKMRCGLGNLNRAKDIADVIELIRRVPLDKTFTPKLPKDLRADFKRFVDAVRGGDRGSQRTF